MAVSATSQIDESFPLRAARRSSIVSGTPEVMPFSGYARVLSPTRSGAIPND